MKRLLVVVPVSMVVVVGLALVLVHRDSGHPGVGEHLQGLEEQSADALLLDFDPGGSEIIVVHCRGEVVDGLEVTVDGASVAAPTAIAEDLHGIARRSIFSLDIPTGAIRGPGERSVDIAATITEPTTGQSRTARRRVTVRRLDAPGAFIGSERYSPSDVDLLENAFAVGLAEACPL